MDGPNRLGQAGKDNRTAGQDKIHLEIEDVLYEKKIRSIEKPKSI